MKRFTWQESRTYWEVHQAARARTDFNEDPEGLGNVIHAGEPIWLNRYYARFQRYVYADLLARIPPPSGAGATALEVGCGAGRWCRVLAARGYRVTGIDLQPALIERNRATFPEMTFIHTPIQEFEPPERFGMISSVTVIQHNPFDEQRAIARKFAELIQSGGHVLILENMKDQGAHVFANTAEGWRRLFEGAGFTLVARRYYDYSPFLRASFALAAGARKILGGFGPAPQDSPQTLLAPASHGGNGSGVGGALRRCRRAAMRVAVLADHLVEPIATRVNLPGCSVHCGFLFRTR